MSTVNGMIGAFMTTLSDELPAKCSAILPDNGFTLAGLLRQQAALIDVGLDLASRPCFPERPGREVRPYNRKFTAARHSR
jgi:hypothetical protein